LLKNTSKKEIWFARLLKKTAIKRRIALRLKLKAIPAA
jgi:hypothetical protein